MLSGPEASSPRPWMKMIAEDLAGSFGGELAGTMMGGCLSGGIVW